MIRRVGLRTRKFLLGLLYITAFAIAAVLLYETFLLARQRPELPAMVWEAPTPVQPTARAPISQADATLFEDIPTSVPADVAIDTEQVNAPANQGQHPKTGRYIAAWFPESFSGGARESFEANKDVIDELSPFWYTTDSSGRLYGNRDDELVRVAHESNVLVIPAIHNIGTYDVVINVISDPHIRARHIQNIVDEVIARNYDGIDIDYESLPESTRPAFSAFIIELAEALHAHGKMLTVAVHAKDCDYCGLGGFQDWSVIGLHADRVRIMTYDYHWRGGGAGPVAPLYWVESVAEYARTVIPPEKIFIGVPFYGYDWPPGGGSATGLPWADIEDLIDSQGLTVNLMQRDSRGRVDESWFRYDSPQGMREVWFMTDDGLESKLELVQQMDLAGIAIWRIGYEKPEYWDVIRNTLVQDPMLVQRAINPLLPEH
jgi:spore germination protein YaaH